MSRVGRVWIVPGALLCLALAVVCLAGCSSAHYRDAGRAAWRRGDAKLALANLRAARKTEVHLMTRRQRRRLDEELAEVVHRLARPAFKAAAVAVEAGDGGRALAILLPLYGGRGLYSSLTSARLRDAQRRMLALTGQAIAAASGVDLRALASGEGAVHAVSERVASVRARIERYVGRDARRPLLDLLGNVARPVLAKGWQLVDGHLLAGRTEAAVALATRLAAIFPEDTDLRAQRLRTLRRAVAHHRSQARRNAAFPGIRWAHLALVARYGGSVSPAETLRNQLRAVQYRLTSYVGCQAIKGLVQQRVTAGRGGIPITVDIQLGSCTAVDRTWRTRKRVSWTERRSRQVRVRESYTAYENKRVCTSQRVYVNTTCYTSYVGSGYSRRTCRANYGSRQVCRNVSRPVTRTRWVMRTQYYTVRLSLVRVIHWYETRLRVSGRAVVRWPGGGTTLPLTYTAGMKDHGYSDRAGRRTVRRLPMASMRAAAAQGFATRVHGTHHAALQPKAHQLRRRALLAAEAGDDLHAVDFALQSWLVGGRLLRTDAPRFAAHFLLPASLSARPATWTASWLRRSPARRARRHARGRRGAPMSLQMDQAFRADDGVPPEELVSPHLPRPSRAIRALYRELAPTAWAPHRAQSWVARTRVSAAPSQLDSARLRLSLRSDVRVTGGVWLVGGVDLTPLSLGTSGWVVGAEFTTPNSSRLLSGFGLRYARHATLSDSGVTLRRSSNLDASYLFRFGGTVGFWARLSLNLAAWLGDDTWTHYHPQSAGVDLRAGPLELRAGATWHGGGGGLRWKLSAGVRF